MICVYAEFEVNPTTTASMVVLNVIANGLINPFTTFVTIAACIFAENEVVYKISGIDRYHPLVL